MDGFTGDMPDGVLPENRRLAHAGRLVAAGVLASRVTGFLRILVLAAVLGLGTRLFDAYSVGNNVPNVVFDLVVGGVLTSVAVPLLVRSQLAGREAGDAYAARVIALVVWTLGAAVVACLVLTPLIVDLYAVNFTPAEHQVAVTLTRFFMPQILMYGLVSTIAAIINTRGRFGLPAWAPVVNNVVVIAAGLLYLAAGGTGSVTVITTGQEAILGLGTTLGIAAQAAVLVPSLRRCGSGWLKAAHPRNILNRATACRVARQGGWVTLYVLANQVSLTVVTRSATSGGQGVIGAFTNAYTLFQLPYAIVTVTVTTTLGPRISANAANGKYRLVTEDLSRALRVAACVLVPAALALVVLGPQLATTLFAHHNATAAAVHLTGTVLMILGLSVIPFCTFQIVLIVFYALHDTRTPALINLAANTVAIIAFLAADKFLAPRERVIGLALGYLAAYGLGLAVSTTVLRHRLGRLDGHRILRTATQLAGAAAAAAGAALTIRHLLSPLSGAAWPGALTTVTAVAITGSAAYLLAARYLKITEIQTLIPKRIWPE